MTTLQSYIKTVLKIVEVMKESYQALYGNSLLREAEKLAKNLKCYSRFRVAVKQL